jgi:hypothetical protein
MGNRRLEYYQSRVNTIPPIVLEMAVVETWKQHAGIRVIQSLDASIPTTRMETVVAPNINVVKRGVLIGSIAKLGSRSNGVLAIRNLN